MSLLRQARQCFVNQAKFKDLNAFVPTALDPDPVLRHLQAAAERQANGNFRLKILLGSSLSVL